MEPRIYDTAGNVDYDAIEADAAQLRCAAIYEAMAALWSHLTASVATRWARLRRWGAAHISHSAIAHPGHLRR